MSSLGSGDGKETEGIGIETVELVVVAEAREYRLSSSEARWSVLVRKLRN